MPENEYKVLEPQNYNENKPVENSEVESEYHTPDVKPDTEQEPEEQEDPDYYNPKETLLKKEDNSNNAVTEDMYTIPDKSGKNKQTLKQDTSEKTSDGYSKPDTLQPGPIEKALAISYEPNDQESDYYSTPCSNETESLTGPPKDLYAQVIKPKKT